MLGTKTCKTFYRVFGSIYESLVTQTAWTTIIKFQLSDKCRKKKGTLRLLDFLHLQIDFACSTLAPDLYQHHAVGVPADVACLPLSAVPWCQMMRAPIPFLVHDFLLLMSPPANHSQPRCRKDSTAERGWLWRENIQWDTQQRMICLLLWGIR